MQYTEIFKCVKMKIFSRKNFDVYLFFAQNIDCEYWLKPPRRCGSNEYPQSMLWSKNKKNMYTPAYPSFSVLKWGLKLGPELLVCCLAHRGPTGVFLLLRS